MIAVVWCFPAIQIVDVVVVVVALAVASLVADDPVIRIVKAVVLITNILLL